MPSDVMSNEELMRRLKAHNYAFPPITPSTRGVLLKKLSQLDAEKRQRGRSKGDKIVQIFGNFLKIVIWQ